MVCLPYLGGAIDYLTTKLGVGAIMGKTPLLQPPLLVFSQEKTVINSHTAIAGAIIGPLLVFFNCRTAIAGAIIGLLSFFTI